MIRNKVKLLQSVSNVVVNQNSMSTHKLFEGSDHSDLYAKFRPRPPTTIMDQIMTFRERSNNIGLALDVGAGSGQFTRLLVPHCEQIMASDVSETQVDEGKRDEELSGVEWRVGSAEYIEEVKDKSVDLVSVCQALHWFDIPAFYKEMDRILAPTGVLAVVGYHFTRPGPGMGDLESPLTECMMSLYQTTKPYWDHKRTLVDTGYQTIPPPDPQIFTRMERHDNHWTDVRGASLLDWSGYISSWSGVRSMAKDKGEEEVDQMLHKFRRKCANIMGMENLPEDNIMLELRTNYWVIFYQKKQ